MSIKIDILGLSTKAARQLGKAKVFATSTFMPVSDFQVGLT